MWRPVVFALTAVSSALAAQQNPIVGEWAVSFTAGMRMENGVATPMTATGSLTISAQGDSLVGTLTMNPTGDMPARPPAHLTGKAASGAVTLTSSTQATINFNGTEQHALSVATWVLTATADSISGTVQRQLVGVDVPPQPPGNLRGSRKQG